ncbi:hypothetical protein BMI86_10090 [Thioclava sp. DLFJ5-1]|nr:hypothetical protein BMI86_10090 [Thioclava sp. DLFJ5-1]
MHRDNAKVLVVEDEVIIRMDLTLGLEDMGFEVAEADSASSALELLDSGLEIDILVTDIDMPGRMNGVALAAEVHSRAPSCRIIVISGGSTPKINELPECCVFFSKPLTPCDLVTAFD